MASICEKCNHHIVCDFQDDTTLACNHFQKEVVRCKECKHYFHYGKGVYGCRAFGMMKTKPDGFCSYGEKREV